GVRSARLLFVERTSDTREAPERERNLPLETWDEVNHRAHLADRKETRQAFRLGGKYLSTSVAAQFRHAPAQQRCRSSHHPGNARPRRYLDHAGLHACRSTTAQSGPST